MRELLSKPICCNFLLLAVTVLSTAVLPSLAAAAPPTDATFGALILQRVQAHSRGDAVAYRRLLDREFVHVDDTGKRRMVSEIAQIVGSGNHSTWQLGALHARLITSSLAVVDCELTEVVPFGASQLRMPLHETDVFVFRGGRWLFLQHAETHALDLPVAVPIDEALLSDYVGRYEWWPGFEDVVTSRGNQLYGQSPGETAATPLLAASKESFFVEGDPALTIFVRGKDGKVTHELVHFPDGKVIVARKLGLAD